MKSHDYEFRAVDVGSTLGWPLLVVAGLSLMLHAGALGSLWPAPRPTLDTERTILLHQADAARSTNVASVLLLGDSSCLMDVSARRLGEALGRPVLNLATFSYLDLKAHALLLGEFQRHHATGLQAVVLLMHPEALRRLDSDPFYWGTLTNYLAARDWTPQNAPGATARQLLGVDLFQGRLLARLVPAPLPGAYGRRYGFTRDLEAFMTREGGSVFDPDPQALTGSAEYRLSPTLEKASRAFRDTLRPRVQLFVGLTPVPARFAGPQYPALHRELLRAWGTWLTADGLLEELPAALPDEAFVRTAHLREADALAYTDRLAATLKTRVP